MTIAATAPAGAPQGAGASGTTPPAPTATPAETLDQRMSRIVAERRTALTAPAGDGEGDSQTDDATSDPVSGNGEARPPQAGEDAPASEGDGEPAHVPMAVFKRRLGEVTGRAKALQEQVAAKDLDVRRANATIELLLAERTRILEAHGKGQTFNPEAEEMASRRLRLDADERHAALQREHAAAQAAASAASEGQAVQSSVRAEMEDALTVADGLVSFDELRDAMRVAKVYDPTTFVQRLLEAKLTAAEKLRSAKNPRPPAPRGVKGTGGPGAAVRIEHDADGMPTDEGLLAVVRARRQSLA